MTQPDTTTTETTGLFVSDGTGPGLAFITTERRTDG